MDELFEMANSLKLGVQITLLQTHPKYRYCVSVYERLDDRFACTVFSNDVEGAFRTALGSKINEKSISA